ncbi:peroxidase 4-like [Cucumis melo var. makuwa]|uniref:Peroxidase n=1 Tax=Cucumis melo var. makuwa TaxID=1194695 RepID=A0A5A7SWC1_CUCMM|nr:peroxidase 4-like [Cucumis melo var. makuwa]TYK26847.1 peroxidase 4-like [Cucumis melo var. makuwa]
MVLALTLDLFAVLMQSSLAHLSPNFYYKTCPKLLSVVRAGVWSAVAKEARMGASLLRLHFHDCFVNGCDGSILLDDTPTFLGEQTAAPNNRSVRGFNVIARGPSWKVKLGRRDSKTASFSDVTGAIPPPTATLATLINRFNTKGLSPKDLVAFTGAHTIGKARCMFFKNRIYNETNIDKSFAKEKQRNCPRNGGDDNRTPFDFRTPKLFDNNFYKNLLEKKGLLRSDQVLHDGGSTDSLVELYSHDSAAFESDFVAAMIKMGDIEPLTGLEGEIRKVCSRPNKLTYQNSQSIPSNFH